MFLSCLSCFFTNTIKRGGNRRGKEKEKETAPIEFIFYERAQILPFYL